MAILMNGEKVEHLVINGEAFDKRYTGKRVEIVNQIYSGATVNINGKYIKNPYDTWIVPPGNKEYVVAVKFYDCYYLVNGDGIEGRSLWAQDSDIKILD